MYDNAKNLWLYNIPFFSLCNRPDLMVKKLRFYARFILVCLLLKKMKLVKDLERVSVFYLQNTKTMIIVYIVITDQRAQRLKHACL